MTPTGKPAPAADLPPVPKVGRSGLIKVYFGLSVAVLTGFFAAGLLGWEVQDSTRQQAPGSARQSPGGFRSYHFWHSGYHGGK
jgi:hypothetical protein